MCYVEEEFPGDHSCLAPPESIPNSEVKRMCADDSVGSPHVKVGHRQGLFNARMTAIFINCTCYMWKWLYQFASPKLFYIKTSSWIKGLQFLCPVLFLLGFFWGVFFAPADYQQGDAFRIIYIHVPAAFFSMGLYVGMGVAAFVLLVWRVKIAGVMLLAMAQTGSVMVVIALVTGSIWGKPMWGAWWVWDARLTSELILFMLYVAILATHRAFVSKGKADKVVAILTLVGLLDLPIIHYSVYWWNTLHQGATLSVFAKPKIATSMAMPLYVMLAAFLSYVIWIVLLKTRSEILLRESNQKWVQELV